MIKKSILLALSAAALVAFAVPAMAQANPVVTNSLGQAATNITAVSEDVKWTTVGGTSECQTTNLKINLTTNDTETAYGRGTGTAKGNPAASEPEKHSGPCNSRYDVVAVTVGSIDLKPGGTGTATFSYTYEVPGGFHCNFNAHANLTLAPTGGNIISISGTMLSPGPGICPPGGTITGTFKVTDAGGEPVVFH